LTGSLTVKNGIYYAILSYTDGGKRKQKWISTGLPERGNRRRAEEFLQQAMADFTEPTAAKNVQIPADPQDMQFIDFMYSWLEITKNSIEPNTYQSSKATIRRYVEAYFTKPLALQAVKPIHIQQMYNHYMDKGLSATTVLNMHANVRKALGYAVKMDMLPTNPAERVVLPKKQKYVGKYLTEEQVNQLLRETADEPIYPAILLGAFYGLRRSEILGLR
jgi:site-specific recombinase XerD